MKMTNAQKTRVKFLQRRGWIVDSMNALGHVTVIKTEGECVRWNNYITLDSAGCTVSKEIF